MVRPLEGQYDRTKDTKEHGSLGAAALPLNTAVAAAKKEV